MCHMFINSTCRTKWNCISLNLWPLSSQLKRKNSFWRGGDQHPVVVAYLGGLVNAPFFTSCRDSIVWNQPPGENFTMCAKIRWMRPVTFQGHSITMRAIRPINELDNVTVTRCLCPSLSFCLASALHVLLCDVCVLLKPLWSVIMGLNTSKIFWPFHGW